MVATARTKHFHRSILVVLIYILLLSMTVQPAIVLAEDAVEDHFLYFPIAVSKAGIGVHVLPNYTSTIVSLLDDCEEYGDCDEYINPEDQYFIAGYGEIINYTPDPVGVQTIEVDTFDQNGQLIRTVIVPVGAELDHSASENNKTCFRFQLRKELRSDPDTASIKIKRVRSYEPLYAFYKEYIPNKFTILNPVMYADGAIEGFVRNDGPYTTRYTRITATTYNASGEVINCDQAPVQYYDYFSPGETAPFFLDPEYLTPPGPMTYRLQVMGDFYNYYRAENLR